MTPRHHRTAIAPTALLIALALSGGCADAEVETVEARNTVTEKQAITVVPEFEITGVEALPSQLYLTDLGLTIAEIRLEPLADETVAYASRRPISVSFDVERGEFLKEGEPISLPKTGRYLVSVRMEPVQPEEHHEKVGLPSFRLEGFISGEGSRGTYDPAADGEDQHGGGPLPWFDETDPDAKDGEAQMTPTSEEDEAAPAEPAEEPAPTEEPIADGFSDAHEAPEVWTPFLYKSRSAVYFTLSDVTFEEGSQHLRFSFDVQDWAAQIIEPISKAVRHTNSAPDGSVDITDVLDSTGRGADAFMEHAGVRSMRQHP